MGLEVIAGSIATIVFASSTMPMLLKAWRTKDVKSYSLLNIILANIGNLFYTVYVMHLPLGPVWALHLFHCGSTGLMLYWYLRYVLLSGPRRGSLASSGERAEPVLVEVLQHECIAVEGGLGDASGQRVLTTRTEDKLIP
jgi:uncharacterized protein with PQ loop repeat